jgi:hypothetical protein
MTVPYHGDIAETDEENHHPPFVISESEPSPTKPGMGWAKRSTLELKVRNAADNAWDVFIPRGRLAHGATGTTETVDWSQAIAHHLTIDDDVTVTFSNPVAGYTYVIEAEQDGTGGHTLVLPSITWPDGAPTYSSGAGERDIFALYYDGSAYIGKVVGQAL